jgi:hypothetical protein
MFVPDSQDYLGVHLRLGSADIVCIGDNKVWLLLVRAAVEQLIKA